MSDKRGMGELANWEIIRAANYQSVLTISEKAPSRGLFHENQWIVCISRNNGLAVIKLEPGQLTSVLIILSSTSAEPHRVSALGRGMAVAIKDGLRKTWELETAAEGWSWVHGV